VVAIYAVLLLAVFGASSLTTSDAGERGNRWLCWSTWPPRSSADASTAVRPCWLLLDGAFRSASGGGGWCGAAVLKLAGSTACTAR
jgi:hypothetical protein